MSDNITQLPTQPEEPWHFAYHEDDRVVIEGREIPRLRAKDRGDEVTLILDGRLGIDVPKELGRTVAWLVANALAIGEGYSHLGAESKDHPFAPQIAEWQP